MGAISEILLIALCIIIPLIIFGASIEKKRVKKIKILLLSMDKKYKGFIEKQIVLDVINNNKIDGFESFIDNIFIILKPEIEGLISIVNTPESSNISIEHDSEYFKNIPPLFESYFNRENKNIPISEDDIQKINETVKSAIRADLRMRELDLKIGHI
ncbi:MAG: hypothetical protein HQK76_12600 [Desulfobacterales bacterium]|nr:hypothetical protein [Desulfobacterales bacterium]